MVSTTLKTTKKLSKALSELENHGSPMLSYGADIDDSISDIALEIKKLKIDKCKSIPARFFAIKLLENDTCTKKLTELQPVWNEVEKQIKHL